MRSVGRLLALLAVLGTLGCAGPSTSAQPVGHPDASPYLSELERLPVLGGGRIDRSKLSGKVVVVQFLASWCFPCFATAPRLQELFDRYEPQGLAVVAVGMDIEGSQVLRPFAEQLGLRFPVVVADDAVRAGQTTFGKVSLLPTTLIIGRDGKVITLYAGVAEQGSLEPLIVDALRKPAPR